MTDYDALEKRLRYAVRSHYSDPFSITANFRLSQRAEEAADAIRDLRAERDALAKDAERYRWLRDGRVSHRISVFDASVKEYALLVEDEVDAAIDAALAAQEQKP